MDGATDKPFQDVPNIRKRNRKNKSTNENVNKEKDNNSFYKQVDFLSKDFIERFDVQVFLVFLGVLDLLAVVSELLLIHRISKENYILMTYYRFLQQFTGFTGILFLLEILFLLLSFRQRFFSHIGYVVDLIILVLSFISELYMHSKVLRLLGILRIWRVFRLVHVQIEEEKSKHKITQKLLEDSNQIKDKITLEKSLVEENLRLEMKAKIRVEHMLQAYKDELETLKEALSIAAMSVAEVGFTEENQAYNLDFNEEKKDEVNLEKAMEYRDAVVTKTDIEEREE